MCRCMSIYTNPFASTNRIIIHSIEVWYDKTYLKYNEQHTVNVLLSKTREKRQHSKKIRQYLIEDMPVDNMETKNTYSDLAVLLTRQDVNFSELKDISQISNKRLNKQSFLSLTQDGNKKPKTAKSSYVQNS